MSSILLWLELCGPFFEKSIQKLADHKTARKQQEPPPERELKPEQQRNWQYHGNQEKARIEDQAFLVEKVDQERPHKEKKQTQTHPETDPHKAFPQEPTREQEGDACSVPGSEWQAEPPNADPHDEGIQQPGAQASTQQDPRANHRQLGRRYQACMEHEFEEIAVEVGLLREGVEWR
jgi:hypothetical protein